MNKRKIFALIALAVLAALAVFIGLRVMRGSGRRQALEIKYPLPGAIFPPDISAPVFRWKDSSPESDRWRVEVFFRDAAPRMSFVSKKNSWKPPPGVWEKIKASSVQKSAGIVISGFSSGKPAKTLASDRVDIFTSADPVNAPIFYREVNLPFIEAVKHPERIRWRFGKVSSRKQPPVILKDLPVCGNCHSFSADGRILGMDVDYANDKGSYVITGVREKMVLDKSEIITWSDYRKEDGEMTFGLLSQVSPDGNYVASTVKDRSVFVPTPDICFSQLFFPVKGILCVYDIEENRFAELPGANDRKYVQSNPVWSPDGRYILFTRTEAYDIDKAETGVLLNTNAAAPFLKGKKTFKFDIYRIPFNRGEGGKAVPLEGASKNGMSNYFPKYSPDGRWIVFCRAKSFSLLQPDSELYIVPAGGGKARRLRCNTGRMNSWHSWSPNSRWLVFSSKANTPYTQLFLTHIDAEGYSSPPVLLENFTSPDRAANIPEFVNTDKVSIKEMRENFVDAYSHLRSAREILKTGDMELAEQVCRKALELDPKNEEAHITMGFVLIKQDDREGARRHWLKAIEINPALNKAWYNLALMAKKEGERKKAYEYLEKTLAIDPGYESALGDMALMLQEDGRFEEAIPLWKKILDMNEKNIRVHVFIFECYAAAGLKHQALLHLEKAVEIARESGDGNLLRKLQAKIAEFKLSPFKTRKGRR